jgi:hypothetical protein
MQALFMNLVPPCSRFFFNSGPKKVLSLSLTVKGDQQTHKNDTSNYGINLKKIIQQSSHNYFQMFFAGRRTHNNRAFFNGFEGAFMGSIMGSQNIMGSIMGVTLVVLTSCGNFKFHFLGSSVGVSILEYKYI